VGAATNNTGNACRIYLCVCRRLMDSHQCRQPVKKGPHCSVRCYLRNDGLRVNQTVLATKSRNMKAIQKQQRNSVGELASHVQKIQRRVARDTRCGRKWYLTQRTYP
jgi:hypothetical protein